MLDFIQWCEEVKGIKLNPVNEDSTRTGIRPYYPDAYKRSQYPDGYFAPSSATAFLDLKNSKSGKFKSVKDKTGDTPLK